MKDYSTSTPCREYFLDTLRLTKEEKAIIPYFIGDSLKFSSVAGDTVLFTFKNLMSSYDQLYQYFNAERGECKGPYYLAEEQAIYNLENHFIDLQLFRLNPFLWNHFESDMIITLSLKWENGKRLPDFRGYFHFSFDSLYVDHRVEYGQIYFFYNQLILGKSKYNNVYELGWNKTTKPVDYEIISVYFSIGKV